MSERVVSVGAQECVTCERCATTFAIVHPACPSCSAGERAWVETTRRLRSAETEVDVLAARVASLETALRELIEWAVAADLQLASEFGSGVYEEDDEITAARAALSAGSPDTDKQALGVAR